MPERDRNTVRIRVAIPSGEYELWARLGSRLGLPVESLVALAASKALPEYAEAVEMLVGGLAGGRVAAAGTPPGVDVGDAAAGGGRLAAEGKGEYHSRPPAMPGKGPGGGKAKKRH